MLALSLADHTAGYSVTHNILKVGGHISPLEKEGNVNGLCLFVAFSLLDKPEV